MDFLYDWVEQIVIVIILGTILDLLLPNSAIKKYVHLVFGLLLLIVIVEPIFTLFHLNIVAEIQKVEQFYETAMYNPATELSIEKQKKEIEARQAAYIWNELSNTMIEQANPLLEETFQLKITDLTFEVDDHQKPEQIMLYVHLATVENETDSTIKVDDISLDEKKEQKAIISATTEKQLEQVLTQLWGLTEAEKLIFLVEGGTF